MTEPPLCILGVDPGQSGALAYYYPQYPHLVSVEDMPIAAEQVDAVTLADLLREMLPTMAIVEAVHSMPKQGVASAFKFGRSFGVAIGVIAALKIPMHFVAPGKWKKHFRLNSDKEASRALALRLWPDKSESFRRKKDADRAEAALLARYGAEVLIARAA